MLVEARRTHGHGLVQASADVGGEPLVVPRTKLQRRFTRLSPVGLAGHSIDDATHAATSEDHRVRTLECLDAIDVVDVSKVLDVVADTIDEEVGRRAVAAQDRRVAISFALGKADTRHVSGHVGHAGHPLIGDQRARDDADRLRDIAQRGRGLGRRRNGWHGIADGRVNADRLLNPRDLKGEISGRRRVRRQRHAARALDKAVGGDPNDVGARQNREFELTLLIRHGRLLVPPVART